MNWARTVGEIALRAVFVTRRDKGMAILAAWFAPRRAVLRAGILRLLAAAPFVLTVFECAVGFRR